MTKLVAYYRVSTARQGQSGLGLEAQQAAVAHHVASSGCELVASFTEVETAKRDGLENRPHLRAAIARAKRSGATLVIAKLDRLARNVHFVSGLMESEVDFVCCDNPTANRLTIHILAAVAEDEARRISERTKAALAAYKARGGKLGAANPACRNLTQSAALCGAARKRELATKAYDDVLSLMREMRDRGLSYQAIAKELDAAGHVTRNGYAWSARQAQRVLSYAA